jgi:6-phosphogluconolactonase (cycloisomerase 2 family)
MLTKMASSGLLALLMATPSFASILWASSYNDHTVTTLDLNLVKKNLTVVSKSLDCGSEPTWLTLDYEKSVLYCLNEGWGGNASLTSYKTNPNGTLSPLVDISLLKSPVSSVLYGPNKSGLAVAY